MLYLVKDCLEFLSIEQIAVIKRDLLPCYLLGSFKRRRFAIDFRHAICEIVYCHHVVSALQEFDDAMTSNVTGASGYENGPPISGHFFSSD